MFGQQADGSKSCKEFENIITQVKMLNSQSANGATSQMMMPNAEDSKSLWLWVKVVMAAPLGNLLLDHECGFNLVKALLEKLWHDCRNSLKRRQENWLLRKKAQL